jgi:IS30 family transposase
MRPGMRFGLSEVEKRDVWNRWKAGQTLHEIGRDYDKPHTSIRAVLLPRGGIPPIARRRSRLALALAEREDISRGVASGSSIREIARCLGRAASTVSREERHSRFLMLIKVPSKETKVVVTALSQHVRKLPATLRRSLTWDRGLEMAKHKDFTVATDVQVYFCDPQSPWQRGTNENTNLLLRQYFPRGTDLSSISQAQLDQVSLRLNQRPRKTLGFETPASKLQAGVASNV